MAGDWIKMRTDLYRDPKVCTISDVIGSPDSDLARYVNQNCQRYMTVTRNVTRNVTVGALVSVWGVLRHRGRRVDNDLVVPGATKNTVDDISEIPGFGSAMEHVGWLEEVADGIKLPNFFEEFNVEPQKDTANKNAERQRRYREKRNASRNVTRNVTALRKSNAREEKRRDILLPSEVDMCDNEKPETKPRRKKFVKPTVEEVAAYCRERGNSVDPQRFIDHYESKGWLVGRSPMADWKAAIRNTWENSNYGNGPSAKGASTLLDREKQRERDQLNIFAEFAREDDQMHEG